MLIFITKNTKKKNTIKYLDLGVTLAAILNESQLIEEYYVIDSRFISNVLAPSGDGEFIFYKLFIQNVQAFGIQFSF